MGKVGPSLDLDHIDEDVSPAGYRFIFSCIWSVLQYLHAHASQLNWAAAVPYYLAKTLTHTWTLKFDACSDVYNNIFRRYVVDPSSSLAFLSDMVNIFDIQDFGHLLDLFM